VKNGKLRELARNLEGSQEEALGVLTSLWLWGLNNTWRDGRIRCADHMDTMDAFSAKYVAEKGAENIIQALIKSGWMDEPEPGVLYIHDWEFWQDQWFRALDKREKDAKRKAESRRKARLERENEESIESETSKEAKRPSAPSEPDKPADAAKPKADKKKEYEADFEAFWKEYPLKKERIAAYRKYVARRKEGYSAESMLEAAQKYADECRRKKTEPQFIKHGERFLGSSLPFADYLSNGKSGPPGKKEELPEDANPFADYDDGSGGGDMPW
jgi:hypothetical protein